MPTIHVYCYPCLVYRWTSITPLWSLSVCPTSHIFTNHPCRNLKFCMKNPGLNSYWQLARILLKAIIPRHVWCNMNISCDPRCLLAVRPSLIGRARVCCISCEQIIFQKTFRKHFFFKGFVWNCSNTSHQFYFCWTIYRFWLDQTELDQKPKIRPN